MPIATRQGVIDFPKRKSILKKKTVEDTIDVKKTPESKSLEVTATSSARKAFRDSTTGITGREMELQQLSDFLLGHLNDKTSGSMYISGLPGTGKTASVNYIIEKNELNKKYQVVKLNCTAFRSSSGVFKRICEALKLKMNGKTEKQSIATIEKYLPRKHKMILLILDEIDQLENKTCSVLYKIFEWPSLENSKLVLIGIANAMDLTDRNLPRLYAKVGLQPVLLHFPPYTKNEITEILKNRLIEANVDKIFAPGAIELIAAKVAGTSGDIRRALDLGIRVVEVAEEKNKGKESPKKVPKRKLEDSFSTQTPNKIESLVNEIVNTTECSPTKLLRNKNSERVCLAEITPQKCNTTVPEKKLTPRRRLNGLFDSENSDVSTTQPKSPLKSPVKTLKEEVVLRRSPRKLEFDVDSKDVLSVVKNVFVSSKNFKTNEESSFPLHQKLLICTLLLIIKKGQKKDVNVGRLHQVYSKVCSKRGLTAVDKSGFLFLCRQVEVSGVLRIGKGPGALAKVTLQWDETEVSNSLKDLNMMSSIINDTTCLS